MLSGVHHAAAAVGGATLCGLFAVGRRAAHQEDPDFDLSSVINELRPPPPPSRADGRRVAAFFDVDGTLYSVKGDPTGASTVVLHLLRMAAWRGIGAPVRAALLLPLLVVLFLLDKADRVFSMWFMSTLQLTGIPVAVMEDYVRGFAESDTFQSMLVPSACARLEHHLQQGHIVILVSASGMPITKPIAEHFKAHVACGSHCPSVHVSVRGEYGERISRAHFKNALLVGEVKSQALALMFERYNIDAAASFAYSDHPTDEGMLAAVGHPFAINPVKKMRKLASTRGWPVLEDDSVPEAGQSFKTVLEDLWREGLPVLFGAAVSSKL